MVLNGPMDRFRYFSRVSPLAPVEHPYPATHLAFSFLLVRCRALVGGSFLLKPINLLEPIGCHCQVKF
jgi:hypothetical protein